MEFPVLRFKSIAASLAAVAAFYAVNVAARSQHWFSIIDEGNDVVWAKKVAEGGYILHFRHAQREKWNDVTAFDAVELLNNYAADAVPFKRATCLSEQGTVEAKLVGEVLAKANVRIGQVVSTPSCRGVQTAMLAWGRVERSTIRSCTGPLFRCANIASSTLSFAA